MIPPGSGDANVGDQNFRRGLEDIPDLETAKNIIERERRDHAADVESQRNYAGILEAAIATYQQTERGLRAECSNLEAERNYLKGLIQGNLATTGVALHATPAISGSPPALFQDRTSATPTHTLSAPMGSSTETT